MNYCQAHLSPDKASHLAVLSCPLGRKYAGNLLLSSLRMLVSHTINQINHWGEVSTPFETHLLIFILLSACGALQNLLQITISITLGVCVTDLNVKNCGPPSLPKAMRSNVSMGFIAQHLIRWPLCRCQVPPIKDFGFGGDLRGRQGHQAQVCQFFTYVVMSLSYKATLLSAESMLNRERLPASIAVLGKAPRVQAIANCKVVLEFLP